MPPVRQSKLRQPTRPDELVDVLLSEAAPPALSAELVDRFSTLPRTLLFQGVVQAIALMNQERAGLLVDLSMAEAALTSAMSPVSDR